jgi:hypothetical protein
VTAGDERNRRRTFRGSGFSCHKVVTIRGQIPCDHRGMSDRIGYFGLGMVTAMLLLAAASVVFNEAASDAARVLVEVLVSAIE